MFFGMCNSPATFQAMMDSIISDMIKGYCDCSWHTHLCEDTRRTWTIHKDSSSTTMGKWSIFENKEMQIQQNDNGIFGLDNQRRATIDGSCQTKRNQQLASTNYDQASQGLFRVWKFPLTLHLKILWTSPSSKLLAEIGHTIQLDTSLPRIIQHFEEKIHRRTGIDDARPLQNLSDQIECIKICIRSSTHLNGFKWGQAPCSFHVENIQWHWKMIWSIWSRIIGNCKSP